MRRLIVTGLVIAVAAVAGATQRGDAAAQPVGLKRFGDCGALLGYAKRHGLATVGPWGFGGGPAVRTGVPTIAAPAAGGRAGETPEHSSTNVQEAGVDEPDIVKTDGNRILVIAQGKLRYVDVRGAKPRLRDSLALSEKGFEHQLFLHGDRALVISNAGSAIPLMRVQIGPRPAEQTVLTEVDVSNPDVLRVVRTVTVDGGYLSARLAGSAARIVLRTFPRLPFIPPPGAQPAQQQAAEEKNKDAIEASTVQSWLPRYTVRAKGKTKRAALARCRDVRYPARFSGLGLVTVLTLDLDKSVEPIDSDAVMTNGEIVYASQDNLYVATQTWLDPDTAPSQKPPEVETALHAFGISDAARTEYRGSGRVRGFLLNQWSLSEYRDALRVASTTMPSWWPSEQGESESMVTVLKQQPGKLVQVGQVGGLGRGERIFGVRFIGDAGYIVTFRQVDPLYTLDLANPEKPVVRGELKLLGYSAYLHPVGEDLLLGVGQDATDQGRALGTQVSLFDVSDLRKPARLDHMTIAGGSSEAEFDHHAFLYWPKTRLAVLPVQTQTGPIALGVRVSRAKGVSLAGKIDQEGAAQIRRALVVGTTLYTVSDAGVKASDLDSLDERAWLRFGS